MLGGIDSRSSTTGPSKPKRRRAVLTIRRTAKCGLASVGGFGKGHFEGTLVCGDFSITLDDGNLLGTFAFVPNVGTVEFNLPSFRGQTSKIYAHRQQRPKEVDQLAFASGRTAIMRARQVEESLFVRRFAVALRICSRSRTHCLTIVEPWEAEMLPAAVAAVLKLLRVNEQLERSAYDGAGMPAKRA